MFFVISGYCLSTSAVSAMRRKESSQKFLIRRALRIYPTFWFSIIFILAVHFLLIAFYQATMGSVPGNLARRFQLYDVVDWLKIVSLVQIFDPAFGIWFKRFGAINGAYWTLAIEFQFYVVMALAIIRPRVFPIVIGLFTLASIPAYLHKGLFLATADYGFCLPYWSFFALGILLFGLFKFDITPRKLFGNFTLTITFGLIVTLLSGIVVGTIQGIQIERLLFAAIFTSMLWLAKPWNDIWFSRVETSNFVLGGMNRGLVLLGAMSYSLYLVHNELITALLRISTHLSLGRSILMDLVIIAATCFICYPFYRLCEAPVLKLCSRKRIIPPAKTELAVANNSEDLIVHWVRKAA